MVTETSQAIRFASIIIPSYNSGRTISFTVEHILKQDGIDHVKDIIIVDSSDDTGTKEYLSGLRNGKIKVIQSGIKIIPAIQRNIGVIHAQGDLLIFIDADAFIIGPITFEFKVDDPDFIVEKVEFYLNDELINTTSESPFEWTFNERFFKICTIKAVAYGTLFGEENIVTESIDALIFNFGLTPR